MTGRDALIGLAALALFLVIVLCGWAILKVLVAFFALSTILTVVIAIYVIALVVFGLRNCWQTAKRWANRYGW